MSEQSVPSSAAFSLAWRVDLLLTLVTLVASRTRAGLVVALVDLGIGITQLDGDVSLQLVLETDSLHLRDSLDDRRLSVSDVSDGTNVDRGLARNDLGRQRRQSRQVEGLWIRLRWQLWALDLGRRR